jgi:hypothetical protein
MGTSIVVFAILAVASVMDANLMVTSITPSCGSGSSQSLDVLKAEAEYLYFTFGLQWLILRLQGLFFSSLSHSLNEVSLSHDVFNVVTWS